VRLYAARLTEGWMPYSWGTCVKKRAERRSLTDPRCEQTESDQRSALLST
jgi:hypothetical protein